MKIFNVLIMISNKGLYSVDSVYLLIFWQSILDLKATRAPQFYVFTQLFGIEYITIQQEWGNFRLEQLEQNFPCRNYMNKNQWNCIFVLFCQNQCPASVEPLWKFTQILCVFCNCLHKEIVGYTKDCGEKFQEVQKLIKSFLIYS